MNHKLYLGGSEEEMEFMPIIPLNDEGGVNNDEQPIPAELPLLPLRNTVLFPGVVLPITVGRDKSIKAVNDAYKTDKLVGVVSQKDSSVEEPTVSDLVDIVLVKFFRVCKVSACTHPFPLRWQCSFLLCHQDKKGGCNQCCYSFLFLIFNVFNCIFQNWKKVFQLVYCLLL